MIFLIADNSLTHLVSHSLMKRFVKANKMQAPETIGESRSPMMAAFLTAPLNPFVYSVFIIVGDQARR